MSRGDFGFGFRRGRSIPQPLGFHLSEGPAVAIEDRIAPRVRLLAFHGHVDVGRADFHRKDAAAIRFARHDLRTRTTEGFIA